MNAFFVFLQTPTGQVALFVTGYAIREALAWWRKRKHGAALDTIAEAAADVVQSGLAARDPDAAMAAVQATLIKDSPEVFDALEAKTVQTLTAGHVAQLTTAPGGSTVALPNLKGA